MRRRLRRRSRLPLLAALFALVAIATGIAVHQLYDTVRREIAEQGERTLQQERAKAREHVRTYTEAVRQSIIEELTSFHVDGLAPSLRQWDEANDVIVGTFQWDARRHFSPATSFPPGAGTPEELARLWQEFRAWRLQHPTATSSDLKSIPPYQTRQFRTLENPLFAAGKLGYQSENLDMLAYGGRTVDPWAGWAGNPETAGAPWVFWYQPGPDAPVRGCFVDAGLLIAELRRSFEDQHLARLDVVPVADASGAVLPAGDTALTEWLPGYALRGEPGQIFSEKQGSARFAVLTVALLLGLFLLGVAMLVMLARREARDAERKATFVSQVSHELRTPLTSIRMFADMLGAPTIAEEKRLKFAGTISRESQRLAALIERLLSYAALEKGRAPAALAAVDVTAVVRETLDEMDATLRTAGMKVETSLPADPVVVAGDPSALKQALLNLIDNAIKYARAGEVVQLAVVDSPQVVRVRVADRGPGIGGSLRTQVFEPFVQGGQTLTDKAPGVGLGLSIARGLLRHAGSDLVLVSAENGATFEIRLPRVSSP